jgi:hypothetical protein
MLSASLPSSAEVQSGNEPVSVNMEDPNLARGSEFVADAASSCMGNSDLAGCLRAQGIQFEAELKQAIKLASPTQPSSSVTTTPSTK